MVNITLFTIIFSFFYLINVSINKYTISKYFQTFSNIKNFIEKLKLYL